MIGNIPFLENTNDDTQCQDDQTLQLLCWMNNQS